MGEFVSNVDARRPSVIVVGAGVGGVATAARLAAAGCKVTVVEKNDFSGGRCSLIHRQEYVGKVPHVEDLRRLTARRDSTRGRAYFSSHDFFMRHSRN